MKFNLKKTLRGTIEIQPIRHDGTIEPKLILYLNESFWNRLKRVFRGE